MKKILRIFLFAILIFISFLFGFSFLTNKLESYFLAEISRVGDNIFFPSITPKPHLELNVKSAISIKTNLENFEKRLFSQKEKEILPIASLTKLMTVLVVIEDENYDLEETILISPQAASQEDVPIYGNLRAGEKLKVKDLIELMLIYSSNDAAWAISEKNGTQEFVAKMNEKAKLLGLENTYFSNPTGLDPQKIEFNRENLEKFNYSTAEDLAKLTKYILKYHPEIFDILRKPPKYRLENGIFSIFLTKEMIGGKTGYTPLAGGCLIFVFKDERNPEIFYINVILGTPTIEGRVLEMQKLIDWVLI